MPDKARPKKPNKARIILRRVIASKATDPDAVSQLIRDYQILREHLNSNGGLEPFEIDAIIDNGRSR